ncbi:phytoene/squalene synthase family protein [Alkalicoccus chagannorensis]|uniref:phytoene/squalene synthase family protein n=1 Tax=Alkalicoccus chagannorensis TaxID=427072 RepID=UPI0012EC512B|nr:phytoene/squalene synthase family protein [Alkalicoccus chagannorensis]
MLLDDAYDHCRQVIEYHSKTFAKAFQHLPKKKKQAVWAVYAFCRTADDVVDEGDGTDQGLLAFQNEFDAFVSGDIDRSNPLWRAMEDTFQHFSFDLKPFYDMIEGQKMDLYGRQYETVEDVLDYSYHVASTVGLMLLPILAPKKKEELHDSAVKLGYAMQITNILRDVGEDSTLGRNYLPDELMQKHGYTESMLLTGEVNDQFVALWEEMAAMAEHYYEEGLALIHYYPLQSRMPVQAAAYFYRGILGAARKNGYDVFSERAVVSQQEKKQIIEELSSTASQQ